MITFQELIDEGDGSGAVDIVITVNEDAFPITQSLIKTVNRTIHISHEERIVQVIKLRLEEITRIIKRANAPLQEDLRNGGMQL